MSRIFTSFLTPLLLSLLISCATSAETDTESFLEKILRITGISATSSGMRGPGDEIETGDIWLANLDQKTHQAGKDCSQQCEQMRWYQLRSAVTLA